MIDIILIFNLIQDGELTIKMSIEIEASTIIERANHAIYIQSIFIVN